MTALTITGLAMAGPAVRRRMGLNLANPPSYAAGDKIDLAASLYAGVQRTVFLFSRTSCAACTRAKPLMAAVVSDLSKRKDARIILVTPPLARDDELRFARDIGMDKSAVVQTDARTLRLQRIPAFVLVDREGTILMAREGSLTDKDRRDLVRMALAESPPEAQP